MTQKVAGQSGWKVDYTGGQGLGITNYFDYHIDLDADFVILQVAIDSLVDEVNGVVGQNTVLPLDLLTSTSPAVTSGRIGNHSYLTVIATANTLTVQDGSAVVGNLRYAKVTGVTTLDATGSPDGTLYVALNATGAVTLETSSGQGVVDLYSVTWTSPNLTSLVELVTTMPDGDDFQDCLSVVGVANSAIKAQTHVKIADRLENLERLVNGLQTNIVAGEAAIGPLGFNGVEATPGLVPTDGATPDIDTGFFPDGADQVGFSAGATQIIHFDAQGIAAEIGGSAATPWLHRAGGVDTGVYWPALDELAAATAGVLAWHIEADGAINTPQQAMGRIRQASQAITTGAGQSILFDSEDWDVRDQHSTSVNTDRVTIGATTVGRYDLVATLTWDESSATGSAQRQFELTKNGAAITGAIALQPGDGTDDFAQTVVVQEFFADTDYFGVLVTHDDATTPFNVVNCVLSWTKVS